MSTNPTPVPQGITIANLGQATLPLSNTDLVIVGQTAQGIAYKARAADLAVVVSGAFVPLAGGTMLGPLILSQDPMAPLGAATKAYVDSRPGSGTVTSVDVSGGSTGLTTTGGPITGTGTITLGGVLAVASGGTGTATPGLVQGTNVSITGAWPNQTINANPGGGGLTSVGLSGGATGLTVENSPLLANGTMTLGGVLAVASGGNGTATPGLVQGTGITVSGSWPNQTVAATGGSSGTVTSVDMSGGSTGLTVTGGPIMTAGVLTLGGVLAVASGGNGTATPGLVQGTNILISGTWPNQTITATSGGGGLTSVGLSGGTTGLTVSGSPLIANGTMTLGGVLAVASGGSGTATPGLVQGTGIGITGSWPNQTITCTVTGTVTSVGLSGGTTGLTVAGSPITTSGSMTLGGILAVANGGSGTASPGLVAGSNITSITGSWPNQTINAAGSVTSVALSGGTTGLTVSGSPITGAGTITLGGTLAVANGGTGTATPGIVAGQGIGITGAWPNQTVASLAPVIMPMDWGAAGVVVAGTQRFLLRAPYTMNLQSMDYTVGTAGGSFTATVKINGTAVTGLNTVLVNASATASSSATAALAVPVGAIITVDIASVTGTPTGACLQLNAVRT